VAKGFTFGMSFVAMSQSLWDMLLRADTPEEILVKYNQSLRLDETSPWGYDQVT